LLSFIAKRFFSFCESPKKEIASIAAKEISLIQKSYFDAHGDWSNGSMLKALAMQLVHGDESHSGSSFENLKSRKVRNSPSGFF